MTVSHYQELIAWQKATDLAIEVYTLTRGFPREEIYGLTSQVRRAAVSFASNIAEGQGRGTTAEFIHYLRIANGSRQELETQLRIAERLGYISASMLTPAMALSAEVGRLTSGLLRALC